MVKFVTESVEVYTRRILESDYCVFNTDTFGSISVGTMYYGYAIGRVIDIFVHHESECAWILIDDEYGNILELEIDYANHMGR